MGQPWACRLIVTSSICVECLLITYLIVYTLHVLLVAGWQVCCLPEAQFALHCVLYSFFQLGLFSGHNNVYMYPLATCLLWWLLCMRCYRHFSRSMSHTNPHSNPPFARGVTYSHTYSQKQSELFEGCVSCGGVF